MYAHPGNKVAALTNLTKRYWQLDMVRKSYTQFVHKFAPLASLLSEENNPTHQQAFVIRTLLIHAFRRVQLHDPQLPTELLNADWPGATAYDLCSTIYNIISEQADAYVALTLAAEQDVVLPVYAEFADRFSGNSFYN